VRLLRSREPGMFRGSARPGYLSRAASVPSVASLRCPAPLATIGLAFRGQPVRRANGPLDRLLFPAQLSASPLVGQPFPSWWSLCSRLKGHTGRLPALCSGRLPCGFKRIVAQYPSPPCAPRTSLPLYSLASIFDRLALDYLRQINLPQWQGALVLGVEFFVILKSPINQLRTVDKMQIALAVRKCHCGRSEFFPRTIKTYDPFDP